MAKVAFIGLGRMGHGMAGRYLDGGFIIGTVEMLAMDDMSVWTKQVDSILHALQPYLLPDTLHSFQAIADPGQNECPEVLSSPVFSSRAAKSSRHDLCAAQHHDQRKKH